MPAPKITGDGFQPEGRSTQEMLEGAEQKVFRIAESGARGRKGFVPMRAAVKEAFQILHQRYESQGTVTGLATGFEDLDEKTAGLAAVRSDHRRGAPVDGQDRVGGEHGRTCSAQIEEGGGDFLDGNVGVAAWRFV